MRRVLTAAEMREADRATIEDRQVPGLVLMENAASAVTRKLVELVADLGHEKVLVLCGKGNNGGDGLAVARQLLLRRPRLDLRTVLLAEPNTLSADTLANWRMLAAQDHAAQVAATPREWNALLPEVADCSVVVDAILGTGVRGPARGMAAQVISDVNRGFRGATVIAVDMPSGLGSDSGELLGESMRTDCTVTFTAPKASQVLAPACEHVGELTVARIGTADSLLEALPGPRMLLSEADDAREFARPRDRSGHKGTYGHVLAIGGSRAKPGAILMAGTSALRAGAGLVTVVTAAGACDAIIAATPELMLEPACELADGTLGPDSFAERLYTGKTVAALGPGLGNAQPNRALARRIYDTCPLPLVIDADGLAALQGGEIEPRAAPTVLTPHPGEMAGLIGLDTAFVQRNRIRTAREFAEKTGAYLVLKGNRTLVAAPAGDVIVNPTGTPGMATAGSGDILTGIVAAFLAQFPDRPVLRTVAAAVYLHGLAGELATDEFGEQGMLATDIGRHLADAAKELRA